MTDRPILFSGTMVRAILDGRKTQTRRIVKLAGFDRSDTPGYAYHYRDRRGLWNDIKWPEGIERLSPYGRPGDRLWVRERFRYYYDEPGLWDCVQYADGSMMKPDGLGVADGHRFSERCRADALWRPSIHMPRWASRITLEVVSVRVEQLRRITGGNAVAEGYPHRDPKTFDVDRIAHAYQAATDWFRDLWVSINGPGSWDANNWVWVVEFRHLPNATNHGGADAPPVD
jgi:hypothetical protein